jgi:nucleotide-binding universal stress UspA family protein
LVATDFEASSARALEFAMEIAGAFGARLTVLHVWEIPVYPYMDFMLNSDVVSSVEDRALAELERTLETVRKRIPNADSKLKTGDPWAGILEAIEELQPDLVVMGTHGRRGINRALIGSVAEKLVRLSPVPVLTVHSAS